MQRSDVWKDRLVLTLAGLVILFWGLGNTRLWDQDEGYFASTASEMYSRGDWLLPTFNGELFGHKPPLMYWGMMTGFSIFGVNEVGARFFSAACGLLTVLLTYELGRLFFDRRSSLLASFILLGSIHFPLIMRAATPDSYLVFWITAAMYLWARGWMRHTGRRASLPRSTWIATYFCLSMAILAKGPMFFVLPLAAIGFFLLWRNDRVGDGETPHTENGSHRFWHAWRQRLRPDRVARIVLDAKPLTACIVIAMIACPWFLIVGILSQGEFLREFFLVHHFGRFSQAMDNHRGSIFYYGATSLVGLYPWTGFLIPILLYWFRAKTTCESSAARSGMLLLLCWIAVFYVPFTLASTKLANYVLPAYPPLALLIGGYFAAWSRESRSASRRWQLIAFGLIGCVGVTLSVAFLKFEFLYERLQLASKLRWHEAFLSLAPQFTWLGIPLLLGAIAGGIGVLRSQVRLAQGAMVGCGLALSLVISQYLAPAVDQFQSPQTIAQTLKQSNSGDIRLAVFGPFRPSMVFYLGEPVCFLQSRDALLDEFGAGRFRHFLIEDSLYDSLELKDRERLARVLSAPDFPERTELVALRLDSNPSNR